MAFSLLTLFSPKSMKVWFAPKRVKLISSLNARVLGAAEQPCYELDETVE